ncbi:uncharacterized protein B0H18DRAFT_1012681, partial [Fomitopsis serialis]|uniref:uncharacterized protein n=1 Tax=Fomitopsis serialis TaxID=139415 RepID=UPI00200846C5
MGALNGVAANVSALCDSTCRQRPRSEGIGPTHTSLSDCGRSRGEYLGCALRCVNGNRQAARCMPPIYRESSPRRWRNPHGVRGYDRGLGVRTWGLVRDGASLSRGSCGGYRVRTTEAGGRGGTSDVSTSLRSVYTAALECA